MAVYLLKAFSLSYERIVQPSLRPSVAVAIVFTSPENVAPAGSGLPVSLRVRVRVRVRVPVPVRVRVRLSAEKMTRAE